MTAPGKIIRFHESQLIASIEPLNYSFGMFFVFLFSTINSVKVISVNLDNFMQCAFNTLFRLIFNVVVFIVSLSGLQIERNNALGRHQ